jgi:hypothetical protein
MGLLAILTGKSSTRSKVTANQGETPKHPFRGVEVILNKNGCCEAAKAIAGQRFLTDQVPMLPLSGCDVAECRCTYLHFNDRRTDYRRASDLSFDMASHLREDDRRSTTSSGRRHDD